MKEKVLLGMPALIELGSLRENIEYCRSLKLDLLEMNMNLPYCQIKILKAKGLPKDLHYSLHLPEELNVWDFNSRVREAYIETLKETIEFADSQGIRVLNMHMNRGIYFTLPDRKVFLFEEHGEFYKEKTEEFRSLTVDLLKGTEIRICLENTGILDMPFIERAVATLIRNKSFALTWDIGHDASSDYSDRPFYELNRRKIEHIHLHDAVGSRNHLPLGEGNINLDEVLQIAGESVKSIILETKTCGGLKKSVEYFREYFQ